MTYRQLWTLLFFRLSRNFFWFILKEALTCVFSIAECIVLFFFLITLGKTLSNSVFFFKNKFVEKTSIGFSNSFGKHCFFGGICRACFDVLIFLQLISKDFVFKLFSSNVSIIPRDRGLSDLNLFSIESLIVCVYLFFIGTVRPILLKFSTTKI